MTDFWTGLGNSIGGFANGVGSVVGDTGRNAWDAVTNGGKGVNWNATIAAANYNPWASTPTAKAPTPGTVPSSGGGSTSNSMDEYNKLLAQYAALQKQAAAQPRFINYDVSGSWNKARQMATDAVSPVYAQKLTDFINEQQTQATRQATDTTTQKSDLDTQLAQLLADSETNRQRTGVDTATAVQDLSDTQKYNARQEGLSFDQANRNLNETTGAAGLSDSGIGQQQIQESQNARRDQSNEQVRQTDNKVEAANTLMNRTFEDLQTKDTRGTESTTSQKSTLDLNLERFMEDQATSLDQEKKSEELSKQGDIASKSIGLQKQLVDQWIQSLSGQGYTSQEIANAASTYGA